MKKNLCVMLVLALSMLTACGGLPSAEPTPEPTPVPEYSFTRADMPVIAGGASVEALGEALAAIVLGESRQSVADMLRFGSSSEAWEMLAHGDAGLVLAPAADNMPSGAETAVIARDALVFWTGAGNSIDSLSREQLSDILSGRVTNWSQLGGANAEMRLFLPEAGSGSLSAARELLGLNSSPSGGVSEFDGSSETLCLGFLRSYEALGLGNGVKLLAVDGVIPTHESVASGEYGLVTEYLAGIRSDETEESPARILWLWLQGEVGQAFISAQGYVR